MTDPMRERERLAARVLTEGSYLSEDDAFPAPDLTDAERNRIAALLLSDATPHADNPERTS